MYMRNRNVVYAILRNAHIAFVQKFLHAVTITPLFRSQSSFHAQNF